MTPNQPSGAPRTVIIERPGSRTMQQLHASDTKACRQLRVLADVIPGPAVWFVHAGTERDDLGRVDREEA